MEPKVEEGLASLTTGLS